MAEQDPKAAKDAKGDGKNAKAPEAQPAAAPKAKLKLGKKSLIVIGVASFVLAGGGGAAWYFLGGQDAEVAEQGDGKPKRKGTPVFVDLETFTANLRDEDDDRFIQVKLVAEVSDAPAGEMLKTLMPSVRNEILLLLGSKESKDVATREGKQQLATEIVGAANQTLANTAFAGAVQGVNFTHIIVQ